MVGGFLHYLFTWVLVRLKAGVGGVVLIDRCTQTGSIFAMLVIYGGIFVSDLLHRHIKEVCASVSVSEILAFY